jgi:hypothetical protein
MNSGLLHVCKTGALPLDPHLQSILLCFVFFFRWGLMNSLLGLTWSLNPPDLSLPSG